MSTILVFIFVFYFPRFCNSHVVTNWIACTRWREKSGTRTLDVDAPMPRKDEEFHQIATVLEHICDVNVVTKVLLAFCCPFWTEVNVQLSPLQFHSEDRLETSSVH